MNWIKGIGLLLLILVLLTLLLPFITLGVAGGIAFGGCKAGFLYFQDFLSWAGRKCREY